MPQSASMLNYEERHKKGDILNLFFEEYRRGTPDSADIRYGSSGRDFSADQEETGQSRLCRAF